MATPLPWSFSALNNFTQCPNRFLETRVLKNFQDESGEAALWGTYVHKCIEDSVNHGTPFPDNAKQYTAVVAVSMNGYGGAKAEVRLAIDRNFQPCAWEDRWVGSISDILKFDLMDFHRKEDTAYVIDWKLGKIKPSNQLKLNALMVFYNYPKVNTVHTKFAWLAHGLWVC